MQHTGNKRNTDPPKVRGKLKKYFTGEQLAAQSMVLPGLVWYIVFCYLPMYGILLGFKQYSPRKGILGSPWVGLEHFHALFKDPDIPNIVLNTVAIGALKLLICFPMAIIFALMLNELNHKRFKKLVQTVSYFPYFISWVIVTMVLQYMFNIRSGVINHLLQSLGLIDQPLTIMSDASAFWWLAVFSTAWKETGWSAIIFLAAITGVDAALYEAAIIDGASKLQRVIYVTLPSIMGTIVLLFLLNFAGIFSGGSGTFDQSYFMGNTRNYDRSYVLSYYVLNQGIMQGRFSFGTAVGFLNSVVAFILLMGSNLLSKRLTGRNLYMEGEY